MVYLPLYLMSCCFLSGQYFITYWPQEETLIYIPDGERWTPVYQNKQSYSKQQGYTSKIAFAGYHGDVYIVYM